MSFTEAKRRDIKQYLLRKIDDDDQAMMQKVSEEFGISHTSIKRYLEAESAEGHIMKSPDRLCGYSLIKRSVVRNYGIKDFLESDDYAAYNDFQSDLTVNDNALKIWRYVLPEMFNNALEHSEGSLITVRAEMCTLYTEIAMTDDGVGIFRKIADGLMDYGYPHPSLEDAATELYKGKFTTKPENHTGEGIFFSMHMLDRFAASSDGTLLRRGFPGVPSVVRSHLLAYAMKLTKKGTVVYMRLENDTRREIGKVLSRYADADDGFIRTVIPVFEACHDCDPVGRSQARRLCTRLDGFKEAVFDFENVDIMGQGFADEVFRVYQNAHPKIKLSCVNMNTFVRTMYHHVINNKITVPDFSDIVRAKNSESAGSDD
ncbi:MAG: DUF4325 domain-containing protein [Lachnospiraceae bacterium]|nr:DUF4325 domain-containing protein [Lachnospiraceae bacterium]